MKRVDARLMDALLQVAYEGAMKHGDNRHAQKVHKYLNLMLTQQENFLGQWWLTDYAKQVLAEIHERLSKCDGRGNELNHSVVNASLYTAHRGQKRFSGDDARDYVIALHVSNVMYELQASGEKPSPTKAARLVAESKEFENRVTGGWLNWNTIRKRFYEWDKMNRDRTGEDLLTAITKANENCPE